MRIPAAAVMATVFLSAAIPPAQALPPAQYHNYGAGTGSCGVWLTDRKSSDRQVAASMDVLWVLGWVSAAGYYSGQPLRDTDSQAIAAWVDKYCRENPLNKIADAAKSLVETLAKPE